MIESSKQSEQFQKPQIRDIPSMRKILEETANFVAFKRAFPLIRPFLKLLKVDVNGIGDALAHVDELAKQAQKLTSIPDCFNDHFAERGWIIFDRMDLGVAESAVKKADAGDLDGAEADLVNYYSPEKVKWHLMTMRAVRAFDTRMRLAEKGLEDYEAERYHACVPVILALTDGLVNDLHQQRKGFFAKDVDLEAWDSIAAHSKGLGKLTKVLREGRYKTTTDPITIPYRNGILHGRDIGYDNRMVAAKTWATLFAVQDWVIRVEQGLLEAQPEDPSPSWREVLKNVRENEEDKIRLQQWKPRHIQPSRDVPASGAPDTYPKGTPERKLTEYLDYWKKRNFGFMARCIAPIFGPPSKIAPARLREEFEYKKLISFELKEIRDEAAAITVINTKIQFEVDGQPTETQFVFRLVNSDENGQPATRGKPGSEWGLVFWAIS